MVPPEAVKRELVPLQKELDPAITATGKTPVFRTLSVWVAVQPNESVTTQVYIFAGNADAVVPFCEVAGAGDQAYV